MRAANFAAGVLEALEAIKVAGPDGSRSNLLREVDYFSTVSGGGMAAGSYIAHLLDYRRQHPEDHDASGFSFSAAGRTEPASPTRSWRAALSKNYQSSLLGSIFNPLMLGELDRGDILEGRLDEYVLGRQGDKSLTLGDVFVPKGGAAPKVPYWITNGTVYENGAIFPFTPDILRAYSITGYKHRLRASNLENPYDLPLAVGLKTSASFPVAIPPSTLKSSADEKHPRLHLLDGGVADNLGIITALRLLKLDPAPRKVLIVIDAYNGRSEPYSNTTTRPGMILTALRTTSISLDSSHQRVRSVLEIATSHRSIQYAVIDFHQALRQHEAAESGSSEEPAAVESQDDLRPDETSPQSVQAVFTQALGVGTWFKIKDDTQDVLIKAGQNAVYRHDSASGGKKLLLPEMGRIRALF